MDGKRCGRDRSAAELKRCWLKSHRCRFGVLFLDPFLHYKNKCRRIRMGCNIIPPFNSQGGRGGPCGGSELPGVVTSSTRRARSAGGPTEGTEPPPLHPTSCILRSERFRTDHPSCPHPTQGCAGSSQSPLQQHTQGCAMLRSSHQRSAGTAWGSLQFAPTLCTAAADSTLSPTEQKFTTGLFSPSPSLLFFSKSGTDDSSLGSA